MPASPAPTIPILSLSLFFFCGPFCALAIKSLFRNASLPICFFASSDTNVDDRRTDVEGLEGGMRVRSALRGGGKDVELDELGRLGDAASLVRIVGACIGVATYLRFENPTKAWGRRAKSSRESCMVARKRLIG